MADKTEEKPTVTPEQVAALQSSIEKLEQKNRELIQSQKAEKAKADDAATAAAKTAEEAAKKSGDIEALEASWKAKLEAENAKRDSSLTDYQTMIKRMTVGTEAQKMASELALPGSAEALLPHIERRLSVEVADGSPIIRVVGSDGKPSALSLQDLKAEIEGNTAFAPLLVGSKASGSGGAGKKGDGGKGKTITRAQFDALDAVERMAFFKDAGKVVDA